MRNRLSCFRRTQIREGNNGIDAKDAKPPILSICLSDAVTSVFGGDQFIGYTRNLSNAEPMNSSWLTNFIFRPSRRRRN